MRKIDILNKDYEKIGLDTIIYTNKTIDEVAYIDSDGTQYTYRDIFLRDYNDVVKFATGWTLSQTDTITYRFSKELQSILGYKIVTDGTKTANVYLRIGNIEFPVYTEDGTPNQFTLDEESIVINKTTGQFRLKILQSRLGGNTSSDLETFLQANTVEFISEKETFLPVNSPSKTQYNMWIETYKLRYGITKETYTLREFVVENLVINGNFDNSDLSDWRAKGTNVNSIIDKELNNSIIDASATFGYSAQDDLIHEYSKMYANADFKVDNNVLESLWLLYYDGSVDHQFEIVPLPTMDTWYNLSGILETEIVHADASLYLRHNYSSAALAEGTNLRMDNVYVFNLKIFDEYMTKEIMDYIIALYKKIKYDYQENGKTYYKGSGTSKLDIAYTNKSIDEVVYEGLTLRDIFEHNNGASNPFFEDKDGDSLADNYVNINCINLGVSNGIQHFENDGINTSYIGYVFNLLANINYYYAIDLKSTANNINAINHSGSLGIIDYTGNGLWQKLSIIFSHTVDFPGSFRIGFDNELSGNEWEAKNFIIVNMSLFAVEPTQLQMDIWVEMYLARRNLEKTELTYSDIFEKFNQISVDFVNFLTSHASITLGEDGKLKVESAGTSDAFYTYIQLTDIVLEHAHNYFTRAKVGIVDSVMNLFRLYTNGSELFDSLVEPIAIGDYILSSLDEIDDDSQLRFRANYLDLVEATGKDFYLSQVVLLDINIFDERITQSQLDTMASTFYLIENVIVEPEVFLITEPIGFGTRTKLLSVGDLVYGQELDFENMQFKINFGINYNAYDGYNLLMQFIADDENIIEYDWGQGSRFTDVRLLAAPKTEKETSSLIISKFTWKRLTPFYLYNEVIASDEVNITNNYPLPILPIMEFTTNSATMLIELENLDTLTTDQEINMDFTGSGQSYPLTYIIDSEKKTIKFADGSNAYDYVDKSDETFFSIPEGNHRITINGATAGKTTWKEWVVD